MTNHFLHDFALSQDELYDLLVLAQSIDKQPKKYCSELSNKHFALLFEKPSLRTRASFMVGIERLGGQAHFYDMSDRKIGAREPVIDLANNLNQWYQGVIARVDKHKTLKELSEFSELPVINALCDQFHPCQALADALTLYQINSDLPSWHIAYVGDANNVASSLAITAAQLGVKVSLVTPKERPFPSSFLKTVSQRFSGQVELLNDPRNLTECDVIYTDVWRSMGQPELTENDKKVLMPMQVNADLMKATRAHYFMHCQPVHRNEEVTTEVCDGSQSIMYRQSRNRMLAQQALLTFLFSEK